jgi:carbon-monoxide dehydrogenase medium subunit
MLKTYEYHRPDTVEEACRLLEELPGARVLAGGTDLLFDIENGVREAQHVISLAEMDELRKIEEEDGYLAIGAGCTAREVQTSTVVGATFPVIVETAAVFACPQVRSRATLAGNICSAVPCGDFPVTLIALGASVELTSTGGARKVLLKDFFRGPRETALEQGEMVSRILVPRMPRGSEACYEKFQRRASNSLAVASVAAYLDVDKGQCRDARIVLGAVAPIPLFAEDASASLVGKKVDDDTIGRAAGLARDEALPITDIRGSEDFRRELVHVLTRRALQRVVERIEKQP